MMSQNCLLLYREIPTDMSHDKYDLIIVVNLKVGYWSVVNHYVF